MLLSSGFTDSTELTTATCSQFRHISRGAAETNPGYGRYETRNEDTNGNHDAIPLLVLRWGRRFFVWYRVTVLLATSSQFRSLRRRRYLVADLFFILESSCFRVYLIIHGTL